MKIRRNPLSFVLEVKTLLINKQEPYMKPISSLPRRKGNRGQNVYDFLEY